MNLVRFADDFIVSADSQELLTNKVSPIVGNFVGKRGLSLSKEKTHITHLYFTASTSSDLTYVSIRASCLLNREYQEC